MVITSIADRLPAGARVILARWFIYLLASLPGLISLQAHLGENVGKRPWFQEAQMPLNIVNLRLLTSELGGGTVLLMIGALLAWVLLLIWLAGAVRVLDPLAGAQAKKVFANGRPFLGRFLRIAIFALLAIIAIHMGIKAVFEALASRAELRSWPLEKSVFDLYLWRGVILFMLLTLVGVFAFWVRVLTAMTDERELRYVPRKVLGLYRRHFVRALLLQCAAVAAVLILQGTALFAWRQAGGGPVWVVAWLLLLLLAAWVWRWRVSSAVQLVRQ